LDPRESEQAADPQTEQPASTNANGGQTEKIHSTARNAQPVAGIVKPYVTVGFTREEVLAQQGTPTAASEDKLVYGKSELYLKRGFVVGWQIDPVSSPIRVKLWPQYTINPSPEYFTIGSSRDIVLAVQGTPLHLLMTSANTAAPKCIFAITKSLVGKAIPLRFRFGRDSRWPRPPRHPVSILRTWSKPRFADGRWKRPRAGAARCALPDWTRWRGPLFGPVVAAAVVLASGYRF